MIAMQKTILDLTAADVMSRDVVFLPQEMSMKQAAHLLLQNRISGAPVVDNDGRCVGVISATDFVALAKNGQQKHPCVCAEWEVVEVEKLPEDEIGQYMTADPVMVASATSISTLAQQMIDAHIHRVIVVDGEHRPIGIVTSTDLLATLAHADRFH